MPTPFAPPLATPPADLKSLEEFGYSRYGVTPGGEVWRIQPLTRGRNAGEIFKVTPVIHPRGYLWSVHLVNDAGKRTRVPVNRIVEKVFGPDCVS